MAKILLVDDDPDILVLLTNWLELEGHTVVNAEDGILATNLINQEDFNLVITDIVMPGKEGIGLIMECQKRDKNMPIIAISGAGWEKGKYLDHAKKLGASRVLTKPLEREFVLGTINELLK